MSEQNDLTGFVIKAVNLAGVAMWVSPPRFGDLRTFGPREKAEVFKTSGEAHATIGKLPLSFEQGRFTFSVEVAD